MALADDVIEELRARPGVKAQSIRLSDETNALCTVLDRIGAQNVHGARSTLSDRDREKLGKAYTGDHQE